MTELEFAKGLAKEAGVLLKTNFGLGMQKDWKEDATPVTKTDHTVNKLVLDAIEATYPTHSFIGEEGSNIKESAHTWVCDPIDGTIPFSHGYPTFAFSLALTQNGVPILGVIYDPIMDRLLWAEKGKGAYMNGEKISVSVQKSLAKGMVGVSGSAHVVELRKFLRTKGAWVPALYSTVYGGMLVATGEFLGEVHLFTKPWDGAAVKIIVEEAGGKVTDINGNEQRYDRDINGFIVSNGFVHDALVEALRGDQKAV